MNRCVVVLAIAAVLVLQGCAQPQSSTCGIESICTSSNDCIVGACCSFKCVSVQGTAKIGEYCEGQPGYTCGPACAEGTCMNNRCEHRLPAGCPCEFDSQCASGTTCDSFPAPPSPPTGGPPNGFYPSPPPPSPPPPFGAHTATKLCQYSSGLNAGAPCFTNAQCVSSSCDPVTYLCSALSAGDACSSDSMFSCPNSNCVQGTAFFPTCKDRIPSGGNCTLETDCPPTDSCVRDLNNIYSFCAPKNTIAAGSYCTSDRNCESKHCVSVNGVKKCAMYWHTRRAGQSCPDGDASCESGLRCVGASGDRFKLDPVLFPDTRVCANVVGMECTPGPFDDTCGSNAVCQCAGSTYRCAAAVVDNGACDAERMTFIELLGDNVPVPTVPFPVSGSLMASWIQYPQNVRNAVAALLCCQYSKQSLGIDSFLSGSSFDYLNVKLLCSSTPPDIIFIAGPDLISGGFCNPAKRMPNSAVVEGRVNSFTTTVYKSAAGPAASVSILCMLFAAALVLFI